MKQGPDSGKFSLIKTWEILSLDVKYNLNLIANLDF